MLTGGTAAKVFTGNNDRVLCFHLAGFNKFAVAIWQANEGVAAKFFVFVGFGGNEGEIFGWDNLIGVDVVVYNKNLPAYYFCHFFR